MATQGACDWCAWSFSWGRVGERWRGPDAEVEIHRRLRGSVDLAPGLEPWERNKKKGDPGRWGPPLGWLLSWLAGVLSAKGEILPARVAHLVEDEGPVEFCAGFDLCLVGFVDCLEEFAYFRCHATIGGRVVSPTPAVS